MIRTFRIVVLALLLASEPARASWDDVRAIPAGTRVEVRLPGPNEGRRMAGTFQSATVDSVVVGTRKAGVQSLSRRSIRQVRVFIPKGQRTGGWIAAGSSAVGMAVWIGTAQGIERSEHGFIALIATGVVGAVALLAFRLTRWRTVYRAPVL